MNVADVMTNWKKHTLCKILSVYRLKLIYMIHKYYNSRIITMQQKEDVNNDTNSSVMSRLWQILYFKFKHNLLWYSVYILIMI